MKRNVKLGIDCLQNCASGRRLDSDAVVPDANSSRKQVSSIYMPGVFFFLVLELQSCLVPVCKLSASDWETQVNKSND